MKKYLIAGALALVCNGLFTSCSEDMGNYSSPEEAKKAQFAQNFEKFYGTPDPNQDWGFGEAKVAAARTRGQGENSCGECIKPDMTNFPNYSTQYPNYTTPAPITDYERTFVKDWFEKNPGFTSGLNVSDFYVQHVWGEPNKNYNVWYNHYDENYMRNNKGATSNYYRDDKVEQATMDYLCVGNGTNYTHLLDFNANDNGSWKVVYMKNSSALSFKYHSSWCSEEYTYFKCAEINVPGVGKGWYVGLCMYGEKSDNGDKKLNNDMKTLEYCDDWIIKVIPGNGSTIINNKVSKVYKKKTVLVHKWVFCEDLGSSASNKDYDYNDLVFDAKVIEEHKVLRDADGNESTYTDDPSSIYYTEVTPLAAGGELTIKFNALSTNAHEMFNPAVASNVLVNTCRFDQEISLSHVEGRAGTTGVIPFDTYNEAIDINNVVVMVRSTQAAYELSAYKGEAPHKICVPVGTRWAYERTDIKDAYTGFENYVATRTEPWSTTGVEDNLYPLDGVAYEMKNDQTGEISYEEVSISSTTEYSYTLADVANENLLWSDVSGNTKFVKNGTAWEGTVAISASDLNTANIGDGTIIRFYFASENGFTIKATDNTWGDFDLGDSNSGWNKNLISGNAKNGYVEFKLNTTAANRFKEDNNRLIIQGFGLTALALTYDNSQISSGGDNNDNNSNEYTATHTLLSSSTAMTGGVIPIVTSQSSAQSYASKIVAGTSKLVLKYKVTTDTSVSGYSWYLKMGFSGVSGNGGPWDLSHNNSNSQTNQITTVEATITQDMLNSINDNVNNSWWSGGMFGLQGSGVSVESLTITNAKI